MHDTSLRSDGQVAQGLWTTEEHQRFINALRLFPEGPWRSVAEMIGTRNAKQAQAHMQKCKEKLYRRIREIQSRMEDEHSSSDSDGLDPIRIRSQRTKHADTLGIKAIDPIPFNEQDTDCFSPINIVHGIALDVTFEESIDFLIKHFVEGE